MNDGKRFEADWKDSVSENIYYQRIQDNASSFGNGTATRFTLNNPYDCYAFYNASLFPMELKSKKNKSLTFQKEDTKLSGKDIKLNQIKGLLYASEFEGIYPGFVFNFREEEVTYWMYIKDFYDFYKNTTKSSININDILEYNVIVVDSVKKRVRYKYDMQKLFDDIIIMKGKGI